MNNVVMVLIMVITLIKRREAKKMKPKLIVKKPSGYVGFDKEFCVDVSTYQPVVWVERDWEECKTDFVQQCDEQSKNVCADVVETLCEVSDLFVGAISEIKNMFP